MEKRNNGKMFFGGNTNGSIVPWYKSCPDPGSQNNITHNSTPPRKEVYRGFSISDLVPIDIWIAPSNTYLSVVKSFDPTQLTPTPPDNVPKFSAPNKQYQY